MYSRKEQLQEKGKEILTARFLENLGQIHEECAVHLKRYSQDFQEKCTELFGEAVRLQVGGEMADICYFCISPLRSSLLTESFDVQLALYDSDFYLGRSVSTYWHPLFIYKYFEQDISMFSSYIKRKIPQVKDYEVQDYKIDFISNYHILLHRFCVENAWSALSVPSYNGMIKSENIKILFGEYMMPMGEIHSTSTE